MSNWTPSPLGVRVQLDPVLTAESACEFAGFLYIQHPFSSPALGGVQAEASFVNPAGAIRILSTGEVYLHKAIPDVNSAKPFIEVAAHNVSTRRDFIREVQFRKIVGRRWFFVLFRAMLRRVLRLVHSAIIGRFLRRYLV